MNKLQRKFVSILASGAMLLSTATPAYAVTLEISGNGSDSDNNVELNLESNQSVVQENDANITNDVKVDADTGDNDANDNTGGDVNIDTGDAEASVSVANNVNSNSASLDCCASNDTSVLISGNGSESENDADLTQKNTTAIHQDNDADVENNVEADAETGENEANDNTNGDVSIDTGNAKTTVTLSTIANTNSAYVGGDEDGGSLDVRILDNGTESDNDVELTLDDDVAVVQENDADIDNDVEADSETGDNDANDNTGGIVMIDTGDATLGVAIDNMANFNWADVDCGCLLDVLAKIAGNGEDSENDIAAELTDDLEVFQGGEGSQADFDNDVEGEAETGENDAKDNTGEADGDPSIDTGDADASVDLSNTGNVNVFGDEDSAEFPDVVFNFDISLSLDLLLDLLENL